jgi:hypothetical protein
MAFASDGFRCAAEPLLPAGAPAPANDTVDADDAAGDSADGTILDAEQSP